MHTFEQAQAEALKARQTIDKLEAMRAEAEAELSAKRQELATYEAHAVDAIATLGDEIGEARRELQAALQRQNDAPIGAGFVPAIETGGETADDQPEAARAEESQAAEASAASGRYAVNPFTGASERFGN